jgi:hypothetical protein
MFIEFLMSMAKWKRRQLCTYSEARSNLQQCTRVPTEKQRVHIWLQHGQINHFCKPLLILILK